MPAVGKGRGGWKEMLEVEEGLGEWKGESERGKEGGRRVERGEEGGMGRVERR